VRHFTPEEADAAIPELEKIFAVALDIKAKAETKVAAVRALEAAKDSDPAQLAIERSQVEFLAQCLEQALQAVEKLGAVLKGIDPVLVDFPARVEGREAYLCWKGGEKRVEHYHTMDDGFSGRRPLRRSPTPH